MERKKCDATLPALLRQLDLGENLDHDNAYLITYNRNKCKKHCNSEMLNFPKFGRRIMRGSCLAQSVSYCTAFKGIDDVTGQLLYITKWDIKYSQMEQKCFNTTKCYWNETDSECSGTHRPQNIIASIENQVMQLSQLSHKNLVPYECVLCIERKEDLVVYLVQELVPGTSILSISTALGWSMHGIRKIVRSILDALVFLHSNGVTHDHLGETTAFVDNTGTIRVTDFSLVPKLVNLIADTEKKILPPDDLTTLGTLLTNLMAECEEADEIRDFVNRCISDRTLSLPALLRHPFMQHPKAATSYTSSRLNAEFKDITCFSGGAFGTILKARNILDNCEYAIKRIQLPVNNRQISEKMIREVELLSHLDHKNVVRYFCSWIESDWTEHMNKNKETYSSDWSISDTSHKTSISSRHEIERTEESSLYRSNNIPGSNSDGIEFVHTNAEYAFNDSEASYAEDIKQSLRVQIIYIQMEFCENNTLRTAINENLCDNAERRKKLTTGIIEGLLYIHKQKIIHRDLKPENIFLNSFDQIRIGDFGLATTSYLASQTRDECDGSFAGTGKVGTTLYVAPELSGNASESVYTQQADMYSLGIILFEMIHPPFETCMERVKTINKLRSVDRVMPEYLQKYSQHAHSVGIIDCLVNHEPSLRHTSDHLALIVYNPKYFDMFETNFQLLKKLFLRAYK